MRMRWVVGFFLAAVATTGACGPFEEDDVPDRDAGRDGGNDVRRIDARSIDARPIDALSLDVPVQDAPSFDAAVATFEDAAPATGDTALAVDVAKRVDGGRSLSDCFGQADFKTCAAYCLSVGQACIAKGCGGLTYRMYGSASTCSSNTSAAGTSMQECTAQIPSSGTGTSVRCCCQ